MKQAEKNLLKEFVNENTGKPVRIFLMNGFQLKGRLIEADASQIKISTGDYGSQKEILVSISGISTYVPS